MFASMHRVLAVVGLMVAALFAPVAGVATAVGDPDAYRAESQDEKRVDCGKEGQNQGPGQNPGRGKEQGQGQGRPATRPGSPLKINGFDLLDLRLLHYLRDWNDDNGKCVRSDGRERKEDEQDPRRRFDILSFSER
ncbi:hypothetical protein ACQUSR_18550 [Streptomyces sp. P1-3]|uniref:hypothetical protein n=1 Tax=Streptomyces sp. P1-3 TaxID=3421658 RepID=UPI003D365D05